MANQEEQTKFTDSSTPLELLTEALAGDRGHPQEQIATVVCMIGATLLKKNQDYGQSAFKAPVLCPELDPGTGILVRMSDKIERIRQLRLHPATVNESLDDSLADLAGYCILKIVENHKKELKT